MSSSTQGVIPQLNLGNTYGALFIGVIFATMTLDALHLALIVHCVYYYLVTNYANIAALPEVVWSAKLQVIVDMLVIWGVHILYVHRIWIVSKGRSRTLPITVGIIVVLASGVGTALLWGTYQTHMFVDLLKIEWATYSTLGTIFLIDVLIASSLCYLLATSRTGFPSTDSFLTKLMGYTIYTGFVTSVFSLIAIITCAAMPKTFIFLGVEFLVAKLFVNSYIALLNARYYLQANADNIDSSEFHNRHGVYRPELCMGASQDESFHAPQKNVFKQPDDDVLRITRPVEATMRPIETAMEMDYFSSV
ncbi:uncharacterized protein EDB91DRAFT_1344893 [Suillus paluster]|uniref:uncharacterized protein n=1 Tax=Suillus paluster TaxID=48578 RepID=UPI001B872404|nr:uncharacterized protein EDB91DRAFT_1344893 [Suillus paluster]KAG1748339.1 hypothetical protein EDB91DRAFT_1344893 [Suillus paluster]